MVSEHSGSRLSPRVALAMLAAITLVAASLRLWKLDWSLPFVPHPDEPAIMNVVLRMLRNGDPNPHFFFYPSVWIYVQALVAWLHLQAGVAAGLYEGASQLPETTDIATSVPGFFAWGRVATALAGAATVPALYLIARRLAGPLAGLIAAAFLALNVYHLVHSHYITTDVPAAFWAALALLASMEIARSGAWRAYLAAAVLTGLAAGTKHNAALAAVGIVVAHGTFWRWSSFRALPRLIGAGVATIATFLVTSPFIVLAFGEFRADLTHQLGDYAAGAHGDIAGAWPVGFYADFVWRQALGPVATVLALWGGWRLARRRDRRLVLIGLLVAAYLLMFMAQGNHWMRNLLPIQAPLLAVAGVGGADLLGRVRRVPRGSAWAVVAALLLLAPATVSAARYAVQLGRGDSRVAMLAWIERNVPPGVAVAAELKPIPGAERWTEAHYLPLHDLDWYRQQGYTYLIASSDTWGQYAIPEAYADFESGTPLEIGGPASRFSGPRFVVYPTGATSGDASDPLAADVRFEHARLAAVTLGQPDAKFPQLGLHASHNVQPGAILGLRTFWEVSGRFDRDYFIFAHLVDAAGNRVAQRDAPPLQGRAPTSSWQADTLVVDVNDLALPAELAPGSYELLVGLFDPATGTSPQLTVDGVPQPGNAFRVATVEVGP